jgi:hypothetical protein
MKAVRKPKVVFSFCRPSGIVKPQPCKTLAEGLRQLAESEQMRPYLEKAHAQNRDELVGVFHSKEGHRLLVVVAAAPTPPVPEPGPSVPGGCARNIID